MEGETRVSKSQTRKAPTALSVHPDPGSRTTSPFGFVKYKIEINAHSMIYPAAHTAAGTASTDPYFYL